jgi:hypothetical protein
MSAAAVKFASVADHVLETEERIVELIDVLVELGQRLDVLESLAVENAGDGGDPLGMILARLTAFENRLSRLERHLRRPPPFPITVIENVDDQTVRKVNEVDYNLSQGLATERYVRERGDNDLRKTHAEALAAFNQRLDRCADQFCRMRERVANIEARAADKGATP